MTRSSNQTENDLWGTCTKVGWVLAVCLAICGLISVWSYSQHNEADWQLNTVELLPAMKYYDNNRDFKPIIQVVSVEAIEQSEEAEEGCDEARTAEKGWERVTDLTSWRGIEEGCKKGSKLMMGNCRHNVKNGEQVVKQLPVTLNRWRAQGEQICVQRVLDQTFKQVVDDVKQCQDELTQCGCHCIQNEKDLDDDEEHCPLSEWHVRKTEAVQAEENAEDTDWESQGVFQKDVAGADWFLHTLRADNNELQMAEAADVNVEYYGVNCVNPNRLPADAKDHLVLLTTVGQGCGELGADTTFSQVVDEQQEWDFYVANDEVTVLNDEEKLSEQLQKIPTYQELTEANVEFKVNLINRQRITTKCTLECDSFRFGTEAEQLLRTYNAIWARIRKLGVASLSAAVLAISILVLFQLENSREATQNRYVVLFGTCLVGLFCSVILIYNASQHIKKTHKSLHHQYTTIHAADCLESKEWKNVLSQFVSHTSMGKLGDQLQYALITFVVALVGGLIFSIWALMQISNSKSKSQVEQQ